MLNPDLKSMGLIDRRLFGMRDKPFELRNAEPMILANLFDAACCYGFPGCRDRTVSRTVRLPGKRPIQLTVAKDDDRALFFVGQSTQAVYAQLQNNGIITWEKFLSVDEVVMALSDLDHIMNERGLTDRVNCVRRETMAAGIKYRVAEVMAERNTLFYLHPQWSALEVKNSFDHPELLDCPILHNNRRFICLKADAQFLTDNENRLAGSFESDVKAAERMILGRLRN